MRRDSFVCSSEPAKSRDTVVLGLQRRDFWPLQICNWHELCHVDGDGYLSLEAADQACIQVGGQTPRSWLGLTPLFEGFQLPFRYSQSLNKDSNLSHSLIS